MDTTLQTVLAQLGVSAAFFLLVWFLLRTFIPKQQDRHDAALKASRDDFREEMRAVRESIAVMANAVQDMVKQCSARSLQFRGSDKKEKL